MTTLKHLITIPTKNSKKKYNKFYGKWQQECLRVYPSGSCPGKFYETAKVQRVSENETVDELLIQPFVSNIGTGTYDPTKYLAKLLSPLIQSEYKLNNTKQSVEKINMKQVPDG